MRETFMILSFHDSVSRCDGHGLGIRASGFGSLSDFGFQVSDLSRAY
jgi:hypothetical protein